MQRRIEGLRRPLPLLRAMVLLVCLDEGAEPGDAARGERAFQRCYACHSVDPHEATRLQGPSLYRIIDRPAASIAGFEYSDAMRQKGADGLVWDAVALERRRIPDEAGGALPPQGVRILKARDRCGRPVDDAIQARPL